MTTTVDDILMAWATLAQSKGTDTRAAAVRDHARTMLQFITDKKPAVFVYRGDIAVDSATCETPIKRILVCRRDGAILERMSQHEDLVGVYLEERTVMLLVQFRSRFRSGATYAARLHWNRDTRAPVDGSPIYTQSCEFMAHDPAYYDGVIRRTTPYVDSIAAWLATGTKETIVPPRQAKLKYRKSGHMRVLRPPTVGYTYKELRP